MLNLVVQTSHLIRGGERVEDGEWGADSPNRFFMKGVGLLFFFSFSFVGFTLRSSKSKYKTSTVNCSFLHFDLETSQLIDHEKKEKKEEYCC